MGSNAQQGGKRVSLTKPDLWYFDQLPPTARKALADAMFNWSAGAMYNRFKRGVKGYNSGPAIADRVKEADRLTRRKV
jgi:hypothetical protein